MSSFFDMWLPLKPSKIKKDPVISGDLKDDILHELSNWFDDEGLSLECSGNFHIKCPKLAKAIGLI